MKIHDIELAELEMKCTAQRRRPIESSNQGTRKISDLNAVKIYRCCDWCGANAAPSILVVKTWDGSGLVLFWKRLEHGAFRWPPISDGVMRLSASQLAALVDGMDWSRLYARDVARPTATS
jgi:transposase